MLVVGFASRDITPEPGQEMPGLVEKRIAAGAHDPLFVHAVVIEQNGCQLAIAQVDSFVVTEAMVASARQQIQNTCGIPGRNCCISATHTHAGGPVIDLFNATADAEYCDFVTRRIAAAVVEAHRLRRPAFVGTGANAAVRFAFNRRFRMKDGGCQSDPGKMNSNILSAAGPADPLVTVIAFCIPETFEPLGAIVHFACPPAHMRGNLISADYPQMVMRTLRSIYGTNCGVVFLNGASGDISQVDYLSTRPDEVGSYWCNRMGRGVAAAAVQALARMDFMDAPGIAVDRTLLQLDMRVPTETQSAEAREILEKRDQVEAVEAMYANELLQVERIVQENSKRELEMMGIRVGDAILWTTPGELFQSCAMDVNGESPFMYTCCVELANGYQGYICTEDAFDASCNETRLARNSFLARDAADETVRAAKELCREVCNAAEKDLSCLAGKRLWPSSE